jgi:hypothetical protein
LKEQHFRTALLRRRATGVRDCGNYHSFAAVTRLVYEAIHVALGNSWHIVGSGAIVYASGPSTVQFETMNTSIISLQ